MTGSTQGFKRMAGDRPALSIAGGVYEILAGSEETGGRYAAFQAMHASGTGPPPHTHAREDEAFYVLAGELTFVVAGHALVAPAGAFVHAPRGVEHTFKVTSQTSARALVWVAPAGLDQFFLEVGEPLPPGATTALPVTEAHLLKLMELAPKYGLTIRAPG